MEVKASRKASGVPNPHTFQGRLKESKTASGVLAVLKERLKHILTREPNMVCFEFRCSRLRSCSRGSSGVTRQHDQASESFTFHLLEYCMKRRSSGCKIHIDLLLDLRSVFWVACCRGTMWLRFQGTCGVIAEASEPLMIAIAHNVQFWGSPGRRVVTQSW